MHPIPLLSFKFGCVIIGMFSVQWFCWVGKELKRKNWFLRYLVVRTLRAFAPGTNKCCWNLNKRCHLRSVPCLGTPFAGCQEVSQNVFTLVNSLCPKFQSEFDLFSDPRLMGLGQLYTIKWLAEYCKFTKERCLNTHVPNYLLQWEMHLAPTF